MSRILRLSFIVGAIVLTSVMAVLVVQPNAGMVNAGVANAESAAVCELTLESVGSGTIDVQRTAEDPQLKAELGGQSYFVLENSAIRVRYDKYGPEGDQEFAIREFRIKEADNQDQVVDAYFDADSGRGAMKKFELIYDGPDRKTVRVEWEGNIIHDVSIFPFGRFIKITYQNITKGLNIVDLGRPGGTTQGVHIAYGHEGWTRDYVTHEIAPEVKGSYYNRYPGDNVNDPEDGGSLNYNDHFILGVYNPANGVGFGRVMPVADSDIVKLLLAPGARRGFEFFPHPFFQPHDPFSGYLFAVTGGGAEDVLAYGKQLADAENDDYSYQCGESLSLTAAPAAGWSFAGWSGGASGTENPTSLLLDGPQSVTATFVPSEFTLEVNVIPADGSGGAVQIQPDKAVYQPGETVTLTAEAQRGWNFAGWSGDVVTGSSTVDVTMDDNKEVTATFAPATYDVAVAVVGPGQVQIQPQKDEYLYGEAVTITAVPDPGNYFNGWGADLAGSGLTNPANVIVTGDIIGVALFSDKEVGLQVYLPTLLKP